MFLYKFFDNEMYLFFFYNLVYSRYGYFFLDVFSFCIGILYVCVNFFMLVIFGVERRNVK